MSHLSAERLAALVDEPPTPTELAHLAGCAACAAERQAHERLQVLAAAEQLRIAAPLTTWDALAPCLREDAISPTRRSVTHPHARALLQIAAALLLIATGMAAGRLSTGHPALPLGDEPVAQPVAVATDSAPAFVSVDSARRLRAHYEQLYREAAAYLAEHDTAGRASDNPQAMRTRLAALDRVGETMRQAMNDAPYDPVINGYYLTTMGEREAALRQLNTALPSGVRLTTF